MADAGPAMAGAGRVNPKGPQQSEGLPRSGFLKAQRPRGSPTIGRTGKKPRWRQFHPTAVRHRSDKQSHWGWVPGKTGFKGMEWQRNAVM